MRHCHALALTLAEGADWIYTSKVFEYLASGTPIIAVVPDGDARNLLMKCGNASLFYPHETDRLATELARAAKSGVWTPAIARNQAAIERFAIPALCERAADLLGEE